MASEHVEMEQVPLKSDTDKPATEGAHDESKADDTEKKPKSEHVITTKFRQVFSRGKSGERKPKEMTGETENNKPTETATGDVAAEKKPKKPVWPPTWLQRKKCCDAAGTDKPCEHKTDMSIGLNMNDRDEHLINEHIKLSFEDILAEPDSAHSWDCAWRLTFRTFTHVRCIVYKILALIAAIPCAIIWGIVFALLMCVNVWVATPLARALTVPALWLAKTWNFIIRSLFDPLFRSCGLCFSSITMRRYGINTDTTADMA